MQLSLALALLLTAVTLPPGGTFVDDDGSILEAGIEAIAAESITVGCNPPFNDKFCPDRELSRAEMAAMISRALSLPATSADYFIDDTGHVLEGAINRIAKPFLLHTFNSSISLLNFCRRASASGETQD